MAEATITFGAGCFWGAQRLFSLVSGVTATDVGYANGPVSADGSPWDRPVTYPEVCASSGHVEVVRVSYDPDQRSLNDLLTLFFDTIDPLAVNRQGNDVGVQYRSGVYWSDPADVLAIEAAKQRCQEALGATVATEITQLRDFWLAEENHQDYLVKNPTGYCHIGPVAFAKAAAL